MLALKIFAAVAAATADGVAFAAGSGVLPRPFAPGSKPSPPAVRTTPAPTPTTSTPIQPSAIPSPALALAGLCHAHLDLPATNRAKALSSTAFTALIAAAGDQDVTAYCTAQAHTHDRKPTSHPTGSPQTRPGKTLQAAPSHKAK